MKKLNYPQDIEIESNGNTPSRLDVFIADELKKLYADAPSRSKISKWIKLGFLKINDEVVLQPSFKIGLGDIVYLSIPEQNSKGVAPRSDIELNVVYEDTSILVVSKQAGLTMHPASPDDEQATLANALVEHLGPSVLKIGHPLRPGIVHRLDKDTSGLLVIAKTLNAYQRLSEQFLPPRTIHREYLALTEKLPLEQESVLQSSGIINSAISRHPINRKVMTTGQKGGKEAITHWMLEEKLVHGYLLKLRLETGRTHQIRVHLKSLNAPIIGDKVYGYRCKVKQLQVKAALSKIDRQMLHAYSLSFLHPETKVKVSFKSEPPKDFNDALQTMNGIILSEQGGEG